MLILTPVLRTVLTPFVQAFSSRVWDWAQMLLVPLSWSDRVSALPFLTVLAFSPKRTWRTAPHLLILFLLCSCNSRQGMIESATPAANVLADSFFLGCAYLDSNGNGKIESDDQGLKGARFVVNLSWGGGSTASTREDGCVTVVIPGGLSEESWPVTVRMEPPSETSYKLVSPAEVVLEHPESHADFLFTAGEKSSIDEPLVITTTSSPDVSPEPRTPVSTPEAESGVEDVPMSLVEASVREGGGYDESVTIKLRRETSVVSLPRLSLYVATPQVPDEGDVRCALYDQSVWCSEEALLNVVRQFSLGANPGQLNDNEWLALIAFFTYTVPLDGPDDLERIASYIPDSEREKISPPKIRQLEAGGIEISFYYETVSYDAYPDGPMSLRKIDFAVTDDNIMILQHHDIWLRPETDD